MSEQQNAPSRNFFLNPTHWKISSKILGILLVVVLLSVGSLTAFSYVTLSDSIKKAKGQELMDYGHEAIQRSADIIDGNIKILETLALSPAIVEAVETSNQAYTGRDQT